MRCALTDARVDTITNNWPGNVVIPATTLPNEADEIQMAPQLWNLLQQAAQRAAAVGTPTASPKVLLLAIVEGPDATVRDVLVKAGLAPEAVRRLSIQ